MERTQSLQFSSILWLNVPLENQKYSKKTKIFAKATSSEISDSVSPSLRKITILVKLNKQTKNFFWAQTGSKLPPVTVPKAYQKFSHSL